MEKGGDGTAQGDRERDRETKRQRERATERGGGAVRLKRREKGKLRDMPMFAAPFFFQQTVWLELMFYITASGICLFVCPSV